MPASIRPSYSPIAWPRRPLRHPPGIPKINSSNPLSHGLAFCWVSCGGKNINLVNGQVTPDNNLTRITSQYGEASNFTSTASATWTGPQINASADFTIGGLVNAPAIGSAPSGALYSQRNAAPLIVDMRVNYAYDTNSSVDGVFSVLAYNGVLQGAKSTTGQTGDGAYHLFAAKRTGSAFAVYRDGINVTAGSTSTAVALSASDQTTIIGNEIGGGAVLNSPVVICAGWSRALTDAELLKWAKSPFGFLSWPVDRPNLVSTAAPPSPHPNTLPLMGVGGSVAAGVLLYDLLKRNPIIRRRKLLRWWE